MIAVFKANGSAKTFTSLTHEKISEYGKSKRVQYGMKLREGQEEAGNEVRVSKALLCLNYGNIEYSTFS